MRDRFKLRVLAFAFAFVLPVAWAEKLIPFQGYLTDASGELISDGVRTIQFKVYDSPVGGSTIWSGEVHRLTVNDGLVNTVLGSKSSLEGIYFGETRYLEIVIDSNGDGSITPADPPLLPRQIILPAHFAMDSLDSMKLQGHDWSALMVNGDGVPINDPASGLISGHRILANSLPGDRLAGGFSGAGLEPRTVAGEALADGSITIEKLSRPVIAQNAPSGGVASSFMTEERFEISVTQETSGVPMKVPGLSVSLVTTGRSVMIKVLPSPLENPEDTPSNIGFSLRRNSSKRAAGHIVFAVARNGVQIAKTRIALDLRSANWPDGSFENNIGNFQVPVALEFLDLSPPTGETVTYELEMINGGSSALTLSIQRAMIVAYEL